MTRPRGRWPQRTELAWPLPGAARFAELTRAAVIDAGIALGLARATATRLLEHTRTRILAAADAVQAQVRQEQAASSAADPALGPGLAGEDRCLRTIVHVVIRDMVAKLG